MKHAARHSPARFGVPSAGGPGVPRRRHRSGFTLIELILVMLIIAISAAIAGPHLAGSIRALALPNTATDLVSVTRWCRVQAISEARNYRLNFDTSSGGRWWVTKESDTPNVYAQVTPDMGQEYKLADGLAMELQDIAPVEGETYITFTPGGSTDTGTIILGFESAHLQVKCEAPLLGYQIVNTSGGR